MPIRKVFALTLLASSGCMDIDTVSVAKDAGVVDPDAAAACYQCLGAPASPGPGCAEVYAACYADTNCSAQQDCYNRRCSAETRSVDVFRCGSECFAELNIPGSDPAATLSYNIFLCATGPCKPVCYPLEM
jgi:hypothetical protein